MGTDSMTFPKMALVRQRMSSRRIEDPVLETRRELERFDLEIRKGSRIAITVGSRGIRDLPKIVKTIALHIRGAGGQPFIVPAMGSHGGATAEGQKKILESLGYLEERMGVPISSSVEVIKLGETSFPVYVDRIAYGADGILVVNRIKPHTEYSGEIESGMLKIMAIGLGNHKGAQTIHKQALSLGYERAIREAGKLILEKLPVLLGVGIVENYYGQTAMIRAMRPEEIPVEEPKLLKVAKRLTGRLPFDEIDVLIVDEMGKNISGSGMDTKVVGRMMVYGQRDPLRPDIKRIVVLDLTEESHGNGIGIGLADFTTDRLVAKLDPIPTRINCIAAQTPEKGRIPMHFPTDREAIEAALQTIGEAKAEDVRVVHIRNTSSLEFVELSEALLDEAMERNSLQIIGEPKPMTFDGGILKSLKKLKN
jgi:hypothetical protein